MLKRSSITRLSKNPLLLIDIAKNDKVDISKNGDYEDEIVKRLLFINLNRATGHLTPNAKVTFTH